GSGAELSYHMEGGWRASGGEKVVAVLQKPGMEEEEESASPGTGRDRSSASPRSGFH
ncbi:unnamed protein product, partial [Lampetra planeri]